MPKLAIHVGTTSKLVHFYAQKISDSRPFTGLTNLSSGLTAYYMIEGAATAVAISLSAGTVGTWSSGGFKEVDPTNFPGLYELGIPNLAVASGKSVKVMLKGVSDMFEAIAEIELEQIDNQNATTFGLTNLDATVSSRASASALATVQADTDDIQTRLPAALVSGRIDSSVGAMAANTLTASALATDAVTEIQTAVAAGAVASVTGAVGSVTGNVGGNVTGSVGSVVGAVGSVTAGVTLAASAVTAIWDKATSALTTVGSIGKFIVDGSAPSAATIAAAIWDRLTSALTTVGSIGKLLVDDIDVVLSTRASASALATVQADTDDLQTRIPAALVSGRIDASVGAMAANTLTASALATDAVTEIQAAVAAGAVASVTGAVGSVTGAVGSIGSGGITAGSFAANAIDANALAASAVDEILDDTIGDSTITVRQALRVLLAGMAGKLSGAATTTVTIRNVADSSDVILATVDATGNRTAVTVTP